MKLWLLKRILLLVFVLWGITTLVFIIINVVPRNPAIAMAGPYATVEKIKTFEQKWGLDKPVIYRYFKFYYYLFKGDLGTSIRTERPVVTEVLEKFPATFELATFSIILSAAIGIPLGIISAIKRNKLIDQISRFFSLIGVSLPNFWLGLLLLLLFYYVIGWVSPGRISSSITEPARITGLYLIDGLLELNFPAFFDSLKHLLLPSFALGFFGIGVVTRMTRSSMIDVMQQDYIKLAKAKGISPRRIVYRHALRNAMIPIVTVLGILYGEYLAGVIVIEVIFGWPGLGNLAYISILKADQPAILGITLIIALFFSVINIFVDILYRYLDPRIKYEL
jgi:peptide/nickel transport system permease protein